MSIQSEIDRITQNVEDTYEVLEEMGATMPQTRNTNNLAETAGSIKAVRYDEQILTEEQKAQARANIGASDANDGTTNIYYGVCDTASDDAAKIITVEGNFVLKEGVVVIIKFTNANSIASPTLNVNGTGAMPMRRYGTTAISTATTTSGWTAGAVQMFAYDGEAWYRDYWSNTTYSNASLGQGYATCSTAESTAAKVASLSSYSLTAGGIVAVKFTNAVPANATLNINSKGAKNIYYRGAKITAGVIKAGDIAVFMYSSYYHLLTIDRWQNDITSLSEELNNKVTGVGITSIVKVTLDEYNAMASHNATTLYVIVE